MSNIRIQQHLRGEVDFLVFRRGVLVDRWRQHNLIVNAGRDSMARLLGGNRTEHVTKIGFGTNGTPANPADTALTNMFAKPFEAVRYSGYEGTFYGESIEIGTAEVRFEYFLNTTEANGLQIRERGLLFDDNALFARVLRNPVGGVPDTIVKQNDMTLAGAWTIFFGV